MRRRESTYTITIERLRYSENPVKTAISCFTWTDAIARSPDDRQPRWRTRKREAGCADQVPVELRATPSSTSTPTSIRPTKLLEESKCETIVVIDNFMTSSAKYADLLLPDLMTVEQEVSFLTITPAIWAI